MRFPALAFFLLTLAAFSSGGHADDGSTLTVTEGGNQHRYTTSELLARSDGKPITVKTDISHAPVTYFAVPLLGLLGNIADTGFDVLEARATDGFVSQIPLALIERGAKGGSVAWIAVEDPAHPWAPLPHDKPGTAGPFYLVWEHPELSGITGEQYPYQLSDLTFVDSPAQRWPQLALPASIAADAQARRGQEVFFSHCLPCHRINGGGAGEVGPDLARPMSPTQYLTDFGLRAIIRNTRAVRTWPGQQMDVFTKADLPDADLDAVVAYLRAMAPKAP